LLLGLAAAHPEARFRWCYRPHRFARSLATPPPHNVRRRILLEGLPWARHNFFHGLNQRLPRLRLRRSIATFHDLFVMTGDYSTAEFRARFTQQARDAAHRADIVIAVSEFTARQTAGLLNVEPGKVRVVHHGVRDLAYSTVPREKVILNVGAVQVRKNISRLVQAFESVDAGWTLVLAGSAGFGSAGIVERIQASPARERIRMLGYVPPDELARWYSRASIFAFPSLDEGFGMPALEAMTAGIQVLASNRSALPEVCGDAALLVNPEDVDELADRLRELTEDEDLRQDLTRRGRVRSKDFSWEKAVEGTWHVYTELMA
jgi:glycosyltransferase involved in cell wall biosynthesis